MATKKVKTETVNAESAEQVESKKPVATLLGSISYEKKEDYDNFLNSLSLEHAVIVLISAANYSQAKGIFNLDEAELLAKAIKKLTAKPEAVKTEETV
jgi:hypothetical protein